MDTVKRLTSFQVERMQIYEKLKEEVDSCLQGIDLYNPENAGLYEEYVRAQIAEDRYDFRANLSLLKLYQFDPKGADKEILLKILLKALANMPNPDFVVCKAFLDKELFDTVSGDDLSAIFEVHRLLETCQFEQAWRAIDEIQRLVCDITGFDECIRNYVGYVVASTFANVSRDTMCQLLGGVSVSKLHEMAAINKWQVTSNQVIFPGHEDNVKSKNIVEVLTFEKVTAALTPY